jgi:hypothetical protein
LLACLFLIILFLATTLLTGMTDISLHMQWPLTSQSHGRWYIFTAKIPIWVHFGRQCGMYISWRFCIFL